LKPPSIQDLIFTRRSRKNFRVTSFRGGAK
jgi:hypothetical protein